MWRTSTELSLGESNFKNQNAEEVTKGPHGPSGHAFARVQCTGPLRLLAGEAPQEGFCCVYH